MERPHNGTGRPHVATAGKPSRFVALCFSLEVFSKTSGRKQNKKIPSATRCCVDLAPKKKKMGSGKDRYRPTQAAGCTQHPFSHSRVIC